MTQVFFLSFALFPYYLGSVTLVILLNKLISKLKVIINNNYEIIYKINFENNFQLNNVSIIALCKSCK